MFRSKSSPNDQKYVGRLTGRTGGPYGRWLRPVSFRMETISAHKGNKRKMYVTKRRSRFGEHVHWHYVPSNNIRLAARNKSSDN